MTKTGDKFVLEIGEVLHDNTENQKPYYRVRNFNALIFDDEGISRLCPFIEVIERSQMIGEAVMEWLGKEGDWFQTKDDVKEWLDDSFREPFSETDLALLRLADSTDDGIIEKYIRLAKEMHRDISITLNNDGTIEMSLNVPTRYHSETHSSPMEENND